MVLVGIGIHAHILLMLLFSQDNSTIRNTKKKAYLSAPPSFLESCDEKSFLGMQMVNITPHFHSKKALLSRDIDFQQTVMKGFRVRRIYRCEASTKRNYHEIFK